MSETCIKCGVCCKNHPFVELSESEVNLISKVTKLEPAIFADKIDTHTNKYFFKFQKNGNCYFLKEINDSFFCGIYEIRPEICRAYPWNKGQQ